MNPGGGKRVRRTRIHLVYTPFTIPRTLFEYAETCHDRARKPKTNYSSYSPEPDTRRLEKQAYNQVECEDASAKEAPSSLGVSKCSASFGGSAPEDDKRSPAPRTERSGDDRRSPARRTEAAEDDQRRLAHQAEVPKEDQRSTRHYAAAAGKIACVRAPSS